MRVCLSCDSEYVDDPLVCRSCGADTHSLEEAEIELSVRRRLAHERLVPIAELDGPVEQAILGRLLTAAGVPWTVHGGEAGPLPGVDHGPGNAGALLVPEEDVDAALLVVRRYRASVIPDAGLPEGFEGEDTLPEEPEDEPTTERG